MVRPTIWQWWAIVCWGAAVLFWLIVVGIIITHCNAH